jgi:hypothetical protein
MDAKTIQRRLAGALMLANPTSSVSMEGENYVHVGLFTIEIGPDRVVIGPSGSKLTAAEIKLLGDPDSCYGSLSCSTTRSSRAESYSFFSSTESGYRMTGWDNLAACASLTLAKPCVNRNRAESPIRGRQPKTTKPTACVWGCCCPQWRVGCSRRKRTS